MRLVPWLLAWTLLALACAPTRYDFQSTLYMEQLDAARRRAQTWPGPAVRFTVTDLRPRASLTEQGLPDGVRWPQEGVYDEARDFTFPVAEYLDRLLAERDLPEEAVLERADICLSQYDALQRDLDEKTVQHEIVVRYGFRSSRSDPCPADREFRYAAWGVWSGGGETPDRARSEALPALVDHIQRSYLLKLRSKMTLAIPTLSVVLDPLEEDAKWEPSEKEIERFRYMRAAQAAIPIGVSSGLGLAAMLPPYMGGLNVVPRSVHALPAARESFLKVMASLLHPEIQVRTAAVGEAATAPAGATLYIQPMFVGVAGADIALVHLRARLRLPSGQWVYEKELSGTCDSTPLAPCTAHRQLETIAIQLRSEIPVYFSDPVPAGPAAPVGQAPESQGPLDPTP